MCKNEIKHIDLFQVHYVSSSYTKSQSATQDLHNTDSQQAKTSMHKFTKATLKKTKQNKIQGQRALQWLEAWGHYSEAKFFILHNHFTQRDLYFAKSMTSLSLGASGSSLAYVIWQKVLSTALLITGDGDISIS